MVHEVLQILSDVEYKWDIIGGHLQIDTNKIEGLRQSNVGNDSKMMQVIQQWIQLDGIEATPVTWHTIVHVLEAIKAYDVISNLYEFLEKLPQSNATSLEEQQPVVNTS